MPLYDYRCLSCGDFRAFRPMTQSATVLVCPVCGTPAEKVITAPFLGAKEQNGRSAHRGNDQTGVRRACGHSHGCSHLHGT